MVISGSQQLGTPGMAMDAELDSTTGIVRLTPGAPARVGFLLRRHDVPFVQIVLQDPTTDALIVQSDEIPVNLGM